MPQEQKENQIWYVEDGWGKQSWHYAVSDQAAVRAHLYHYFGNEGLQKKPKETPRATVAPTYVGSNICTDPQCTSLAGVPYQTAQKLDSERRAATRDLRQ